MCIRDRLINDGRLLRDNMKKMDVDDDWLRRQLKREHLKDPSQAVSYTHLDVYKRQCICASPRSCT